MQTEQEKSRKVNTRERNWHTSKHDSTCTFCNLDNRCYTIDQFLSYSKKSQVKKSECYTVHMNILDPILKAHIQHADPFWHTVIIVCEFLFQSLFNRFRNDINVDNNDLWSKAMFAVFSFKVHNTDMIYDLKYNLKQPLYYLYNIYLFTYLMSHISRECVKETIFIDNWACCYDNICISNYTI